MRVSAAIQRLPRHPRLHPRDRPPATLARLHLRAVTASAAATARLRAQVFHANVECDAQPLQLSLRACVAPADPGCGLVLDTRFGSLVWHAPATLWQTLVGIAPDAGPQRSRLALYQAALALLPAPLRVLLGEPVVRTLCVGAPGDHIARPEAGEFQAAALCSASRGGQIKPPLASSPAASAWLQLDCRCGELTLTSHLAADTRCWQALLVHWRAAPAMPFKQLNSLPVKLAVLAGHLQLCPAQALTLAPGDVLRLSACRFDADGVGSIDLQTCRLMVSWQEDRKHFVFLQFETRTTMQADYEDEQVDAYYPEDHVDADVDKGATIHYDDDTDNEDDSESEDDYRRNNDVDADHTPSRKPYSEEHNEHWYAHDSDDSDQHDADDDAVHAFVTGSPHGASGLSDSTLEQLPFEIKVVLGHFELSLQALRGLAPGAVLELAQGLPPQVTLETQGRHLGRGELVTLDGALAVQLLSWLEPSQEYHS